MNGRKHWLGFLAIGVGLVTLMISLGGHLGWPDRLMETTAGSGGRQRTVGAARQAPAQAGAAQQAPVQATVVPGTAQGQALPQRGVDRGNTRDVQAGPVGRGMHGDREGGPFGLLLGGIIPLVGGVLVAGLGLGLFLGSRRPGGPVGGQPVRGEQDWQEGPAAPTAAAPHAQPAPSAATPVPPQAPHPAPAHTGETTRLYDF